MLSPMYIRAGCNIYNISDSTVASLDEQQKTRDLKS